MPTPFRRRLQHGASAAGMLASVWHLSKVVGVWAAWPLVSLRLRNAASACLRNHLGVL